MTKKYLQIIAFTGFSLGMLGQGNAMKQDESKAIEQAQRCMKKCHDHYGYATTTGRDICIEKVCNIGTKHPYYDEAKKMPW
jgi:hypothetical protein